MKKIAIILLAGVLSLSAGPALACTPEPPVDALWSPEPGQPWQWQLSSIPKPIPGVSIYGFDGADATAQDVANLGDSKTICYFSAGTVENWREDAGAFPDSVIGNPMDDWEGEKWLDIRQLDVLIPIMETRIQDCADKGFDAVEPDNIDAYSNDSGFNLSAEDQLAYNKALANAAHEAGLSIALKNDVEQVAELEPYFDFAINEECFQWNECKAYRPFVEEGKAVLNVEYNRRFDCDRAEELGLTSMQKRLALGPWRDACPAW